MQWRWCWVGLWILLLPCVVVATPTEPGDIFYPAETEAVEEEPLQPRSNRPGLSTTSKVTLTLSAIAVVAGAIFYLRRKGAMGGMSSRESGMLRIRESRMLGNRQFLVVAEYGERRMLLGIGPGMINYLRDLESNSDEPEPLPPELERLG